jgi:hypothetical protein
VRRWISRFNAEGAAGLADRLGGRRLGARITALLGQPGPWTVPRIWRRLGRPRLSPRTLYRRVRLAAVWRRPKLAARGDPWHDHVVAAIMARLIELPRRAVVCVEDETHLHLLPHIRASWTRRGDRPQVRTPGANRQVTVFGALEMTTGQWVYRLGHRCAADFTAFPGQLLRAFPRAPVIVVICDNDAIHHAARSPPSGRSIPGWSYCTARGTGMRPILALKHIILIDSGSHKHTIVHQASHGAVTPDVPASHLQHASNVK